MALTHCEHLPAQAPGKGTQRKSGSLCPGGATIAPSPLLAPPPTHTHWCRAHLTPAERDAKEAQAGERTFDDEGLLLDANDHSVGGGASQTLRFEGP